MVENPGSITTTIREADRWREMENKQIFRTFEGLLSKMWHIREVRPASVIANLKISIFGNQFLFWVLIGYCTDGVANNAICLWTHLLFALISHMK